jgi:hypothetical protein
MDRLLKVATYEPYVIKSGGLFRYVIRLGDLNGTAILRLWIASRSNEVLSSPLYIRYGCSAAVALDRAFRDWRT